MNKKEFIKELTKKLQVLEESEIKDIIDEYTGIIDEKVKHGKTEEEAVKDFGDIDELAEEILSAYKINPNYKKGNDTVKNIVDDCEVLIKKGASKLTDFSKRVVEDIKKEDSSFHVETMFEIIIKIIIMLLIFALIRIPFDIIFHIGSGLLGVLFYPLDVVLIAIWRIIIIVANLVSCALIFIMMFKRYFNTWDSDKGKKVVERTTTKKTVKKNIKDENQKQDYKKENYIEERYTAPTNEVTIVSVLLMLVKVFVVIAFVIPLVFANIGIFVAISVLIFAIIKGINVVGLAILLLGLGITIAYIINLVYDAIFNHKKVYVYPFIIGTILIVVGGLVFFEESLSFNYTNRAPATNFIRKTDVYEEKINDDTDIIVRYGTKKYIEDNKLEDNEVIIEVKYYEDLIDTKKVDYNNRNEIVIDIDQENYQYKNKVNRKMYDLVIDNLKDNEVYNYAKLFQTNVSIYANSETMELLK